MPHVFDTFLPRFPYARPIREEGDPPNWRAQMDRRFPGINGPGYGETTRITGDLLSRTMEGRLPTLDLSEGPTLGQLVRIGIQREFVAALLSAAGCDVGRMSELAQHLRDSDYGGAAPVPTVEQVDAGVREFFARLDWPATREEIDAELARQFVEWGRYMASLDSTESTGPAWSPELRTVAPEPTPEPHAALHDREYVAASPFAYRVSERPGTGYLASYHGAAKPWHESSSALFADVPKLQRGYSVELECEFPTQLRRNTAIGKMLAGCMSPCGRFVAETDGSLGSGGVEIIGAPMTLAAIQSADGPWARMLAALRGHGAAGWRNRARAGIHVNVDLRGVSNSQRVRFYALVSGSDWSPAVAGRVRLYGGAQYVKFASEGQAAQDAQRRRKYAPVFFRNTVHPCAEVRIFGSNLAHYGFALCVEFCDAALAYAADPKAIVIGPGERDAFRAFVVSDPDRAARWPRLANRMRKTRPSVRASRDARTVA